VFRADRLYGRTDNHKEASSRFSKTALRRRLKCIIAVHALSSEYCQPEHEANELGQNLLALHKRWRKQGPSKRRYLNLYDKIHYFTSQTNRIRRIFILMCVRNSILKLYWCEFQSSNCPLVRKRVQRPANKPLLTTNKLCFVPKEGPKGMKAEW
jgi:hypothetical protein